MKAAARRKPLFIELQGDLSLSFVKDVSLSLGAIPRYGSIYSIELGDERQKLVFQAVLPVGCRLPEIQGERARLLVSPGRWLTGGGDIPLAIEMAADGSALALREERMNAPQMSRLAAFLHLVAYLGAPMLVSFLAKHFGFIGAPIAAGIVFVAIAEAAVLGAWRVLFRYLSIRQIGLFVRGSSSVVLTVEQGLVAVSQHFFKSRFSFKNRRWVWNTGVAFRVGILVAMVYVVVVAAQGLSDSGAFHAMFSAAARQR